MSLTKGALNVLFIIQKCIITPCYFVRPNSSSIRATDEPFLNSRFAQRAWKISQYVRAFLLTLLTWRIRWIFVNWHKSKLSQLGMCFTIFSIKLISLFAQFTVERLKHEIVIGMTQLFKHVKVDGLNRKSEISVRVLCIYGLALSFISFPAALGCFPLIGNHEPLENFLDALMLHGKRSRLISKLAASFVYVSVSTYGAATFLSVMLLVVMFGEATQKLSMELRSSSFRLWGLYGKTFTSKRFEVHCKFAQCLKQFRLLQILTIIGRQLSSDFIAVLAFFGIITASSAAVCALILYQYLPIFVGISCFLIVMIVFTFVFLLSELASSPNTNSIRFKAYWSCLLTSRFCRRQLNSCPVISYSIGVMVVHVRPSTALSISDVILNCTATLALMGDFNRIRTRI
ncbi:unnamed protein product [Orchesella dallaii]|uniref:Odorant receptor n=1 Tax=Orchesella dallaii TaxID=48710 RepID=A0ABP1RJ68_9HEXA